MILDDVTKTIELFTGSFIGNTSERDFTANEKPQTVAEIVQEHRHNVAFGPTKLIGQAISQMELDEPIREASLRNVVHSYDVIGSAGGVAIDSDIKANGDANLLEEALKGNTEVLLQDPVDTGTVLSKNDRLFAEMKQEDVENGSVDELDELRRLVEKAAMRNPSADDSQFALAA